MAVDKTCLFWFYQSDNAL